MSWTGVLRSRGGKNGGRRRDSNLQSRLHLVQNSAGELMSGGLTAHVASPSLSKENVSDGSVPEFL